VNQTPETLGATVPADLDAWLQDALPDVEGPIEMARIGGVNATSNEMFSLRDRSHQWVLRRPPAVGNAPGAHNVVREFGILQALGPTDVPHAPAVALCQEPSVFERPFYVMGHVSGFPGQRPLPEPYGSRAAVRHGLGIELVDALATLARVDHRAVGLDGLGHPEGFLDRQVDRWLGQLDSYRTRELPGLDDVVSLLRANQPPDGSPGLLHGDYSPFNVLYAYEPQPRLVAIVDWEMATIGDPLLDIGWVLGQWSEPGGEELVDDGITALPGMATMGELADRYEERSGRSLEHVRYYMTLAVFKIACIIEGAYTRFVRGQSSHAASHERFGAMVPRMIRRAHGIAEGTLATGLGSGR
jgi:aminoglycoside phosphotransferase (APT) family kinase protein